MKMKAHRARMIPLETDNREYSAVKSHARSQAVYNGKLPSQNFKKKYDKQSSADGPSAHGKNSKSRPSFSATENSNKGNFRRRHSIATVETNESQNDSGRLSNADSPNIHCPGSKDRMSVSGRDNEVTDSFRRRHSVAVTGINESDFSSKSTQTTHSQVQMFKPLLISKSTMTALKPKLEPKPILKCTSNASERLKNQNSSSEDYESCSIASTSDIKFCYRLPEKRQAKLRKSVSFREDSHRLKVKDYSRRYGSPIAPLTDGILNLDDMQESLVDF